MKIFLFAILLCIFNTAFAQKIKNKTIFLNKNNGKTTFAITENIQIINVATAQVDNPSILMPLVNAFVNISPINVVTSAMPPIKYGAFLNATLVINGPSITVTSVKKRAATINDAPFK